MLGVSKRRSVRSADIAGIGNGDKIFSYSSVYLTFPAALHPMQIY